MKIVRDSIGGRPKYTHFIVSESADVHYQMLVSGNGKLAGNEHCKNAKDLRNFLLKYMIACANSRVRIVQVSAEEFKAKYPKFAANNGPKKRK